MSYREALDCERKTKTILENIPNGDSKANSIANLKFEDLFSGKIPTFFQARKIFSEQAYNRDLLKMIKEGNEEKINMKKKKKENIEKLSKFQKEWSKTKEIEVKLKSTELEDKDSKANSIANLKFEDLFSGEIPTFFQARKIFSEQAYDRDLLKMIKEGNEEKINMKKKKKENIEKLSKFQKEWSKTKEIEVKLKSTELEDKELPRNVKIVKLRIANEHLDDFVLIYALFNKYWLLLDVESYFLEEMNIELLEESFVEEQITGPLNIIVQDLLRIIIDFKEDKEADMKENNNTGCELDYHRCDEKPNTARQLTNLREWGMKHLNQPLNKILFQPTVISEVLRIYLLSSGERKTLFEWPSGYNLF